MSITVEEAARQGKVIFTEKAKQKMNQWHLSTKHITETLERGFPIECLIKESGFYQKHHRYQQEKEIDVIYTITAPNGYRDGGVTILSCWARNVR